MRNLIVLLLAIYLGSCSTPESPTAAVNEFFEKHPEYDASLIPDECQAYTGNVVNLRIVSAEIEENIFFSGAPLVKYHVNDLNIELRYLVFKRSGSSWPKPNSYISATLFEGLIDCGGIAKFNGILFLK